MSATLLASASASRTQSSVEHSSATTRWASRILFGFVILFLVFDLGVKLVGTAAVVQGSAQMGIAPHLLRPIGLIEVVCLVLYLIPRTAPLGAVLWTGYLGGAVATNMRLEHALFSNTLTPIYAAVFIWGALYLRDARVRAVLGPNR